MPSAGELTVWKNQTQRADGTEATRTFTHHGGRARVACEKAVPAATSTMAPSAVVQAISPSEAQAAIATTTVARQASRSRTESSGSPGWLARRTTSMTLTVGRRRPGPPPATARARRRPALRRSVTGSTTGPDSSLVPSSTGAPPCSRSHDRAERAFRHPLGRVGVGGQLHRDRDRLGRGLLDLSHHEATGMGRRAPVDEAAGVAGDVGTGAPGQPGLDARLLDTVARPVVGAPGTAAGPRHNGAPRAAGRGAAAAPASSTTAVRTAPPTRRRASRTGAHHGASAPAPRARRPCPADCGAPRTCRGPAAPPAGRAPGCSQSTRSETGSPATPSPGALRRLIRARVTTKQGPTTPMSSAPKTRSPSSWTHPDPALWAISHHRTTISTLATIGPRGRAGRAQRLTAWARGSFREGPGPPRPTGRRPASASTVRMRWDRQATATAFTSSGTTIGPGVEHGVCLSGADEPDGGAGAGAEMHAGRRAAGPAELHGIGGHRIVHRHGLGRLLGAPPFLGRADRTEVGQGVGAPAVEGQAHLVRRVGVPEACRHGEAVELALDQREGAALRVRVLRGDDQVGLRQGPGLAVHADLVLLHRLEQRRLRARRRAVELVHQHDVGEHGAGPEIPRAGVGHEDRHARDVGRAAGRGVPGPATARHRGRWRGSGPTPSCPRPARPRRADGRPRARPRRPTTSAPRLPEDDLFEIAHERLTQRDGAVQVAHALVDDAHRVTAVPWAMGAKTTGVTVPAGPRPGRRATSHGCSVPPRRRAQTSIVCPLTKTARADGAGESPLRGRRV